MQFGQFQLYDQMRQKKKQWPKFYKGVERGKEINKLSLDECAQIIYTILKRHYNHVASTSITSIIVMGCMYSIDKWKEKNI